MPSPERHRRQADYNLQALESLRHQSVPFYNWLTTIAFYSALHRVDARLAESGHHPLGHESRDGFLSKVREFRTTVYPNYRVLKDAADKARYHCSYISAQQWTREIEPALCTIDRELASP